jgi:transmembrane sensor
MIVQQNIEKTRQQAAKYITRLYSGDLSAQEEEEICDWCDAHPHNQLEFDALLDIWDISNNLYTPIASIESKRSWPFTYGAISASFILFILFSLWGLSPDHLSEFVQTKKNLISVESSNYYQTAVGEVKKMRLSDGSILTLNTNSAIEVDFSGHQRRVLLHRGEVFFDVKKDPNRVFSINTGQRIIRVIGTKFNVRKSDVSLKVSVSEGLVGIQESSSEQSKTDDFRQSETLLQAGSIGAYSGNTEVISRNTPELIKKNLAWREGVFRFENETLENVINEFNRYRIKKIKLQTDELGQLKISGVFSLKNSDSIITAIKTALPVNTQESSQFITLIEK